MSSSPDFLVENHATALNVPSPSESAVLHGVELRLLTPPGVGVVERRPNSSKAAAPSASHYDSEIYRPEIDKALAHAKRILRRRVVFIKGMPTKSQADMDFEDLVQEVNVEILKAMRHYDDQMNARLAYRIAENRAQLFLRKRIESQTVLAVDAEGNPLLDELGLDLGLDGSKLKRQTEDPNAAREERQKAGKVIQRYARRYPRFVSLDHELERNDERTGRILASVHQGSSQFQERVGSDLLRTFRDRGGLPALKQLVSTWHGDKRRVAEAMLEPDFTVRGVSGLDKSKVSRIRRGVLKDFRAFLTR